MATLFFLFAIPFIFVELISIEDGAKISIELRKARLLKGEDNKQERKKIFESHNEFILFSLVYLIWLFIGIMMSSQWLWFAVIFAQGFVVGFITKKMSDEWYVKCKYVDVAISVAILVWVAWNHFHH